jgi:hypothetical protein
VLPAVPCETPIFAFSERVGHGPGPAGAAAEAAGVGVDAAGVACAVALAEAEAVVVVDGAADGLDEAPQAVMSAATQASAAPAIARPAA